MSEKQDLHLGSYKIREEIDKIIKEPLEIKGGELVLVALTNVIAELIHKDYISLNQFCVSLRETVEYFKKNFYEDDVK